MMYVVHGVLYIVCCALYVGYALSVANIYFKCFKNGHDLKNEDDLENEGNLKIKDDINDEDDLNKENNLQIKKK